MRTSSKGAFIIFALLLVLSAILLRAPVNPEVPPLFGVFLTLASCVVIWMPGFAFAFALANRADEVETVCAFVTGCGLAGFLLFVAWFIGRGTGVACVVLILCGSLAVVYRKTPSAAALRRPTILALVAATLYFAIAADHGGLAQANDFVAHRYWDGPDNIIPQLFADTLLKGRSHLTPSLMGNWQSSDRPPLFTGMMLTAYPFVSEAQKNTLALTLGIAANVLWVFGLWAFLRALRINKSTASFVLVSVTLAGPVYMNTVYVWPKLLAGAFVLCAGAIAISDNPLSKWRVFIIGACVAFGLLSHGAVAFGVIGMLPLFIASRRRWNVRLIAACAASFLVLYVPWMAYQKYFDSPGNRLVKWHLADVHEVTPQKPLEAIVESYRALSTSKLIENKENNFKMLVGVFPVVATAQHGWTHDLAGKIRRAQSFSLGPTPLFGLLGLLLIFARRREYWWSPMILTIVCSAIAYCLIEFGGTYWAIAWLHTTPLSLLLLWVGLGPLLVSKNTILSRAMLLATAASFGWLWIVSAGRLTSVGLGMGATDKAMTVVQLLMLSYLLIAGMKWAGESSNADDQSEAVFTERAVS